MFISEFRQRKKNAEIKREIRKRLLFNQQVRTMETGERRMKQCVQSLKQKAVEAEQFGDHESALRFAAEAQRLRKQLRVTGNMKDTVMEVWTIGDSTRTLNGMMKDVNEIAGSIGSLGAEDIIDTQINMETARENMDGLMSFTSEIYESLSDISSSENREEGETVLRMLLSASEKDKYRNLLLETTRQLDSVNKNRITE